MSEPSEFINIAAYLFASLTNLEERRKTLRSLCHNLALRGTIILSPEGINLFVAGTRANIDTFLWELRADPQLADIPVKESLSDHQPFERMLIKIKDEIIAFGVDGIAPQEYTSKRIMPQELKEWLDSGKSVTLLDTRNDYEVELGTFESAIPIGVNHFRDFPEAVDKLPVEMKQQPIVTFCTGGIRCEKAAPYLESRGFTNVYQLDGGILKYFEDCGGEHYNGDCFVFDRRVAVDSSLEETETTVCFTCLAPVTPEEQQLDSYVPGKFCLHCFDDRANGDPEGIDSRHAEIAAATSPLPGSVPYTNRRPLHVPQKYDGWNLIEFLCDAHPQVGREQWLETIESECLELKGQSVVADRMIRNGESYWQLIPNTVEPGVNGDIRIVHEDDTILVVDKPAPLPVHPCGRFNKNTLTHILGMVYRNEKLRPAHRLDSNTSGLIVFCRSRRASSIVQPQFENQTVKKHYVCLVHGHPTEDEFVCSSPIAGEPNQFGLRNVDDNGLPAETYFRVITRLDSGSAVVEAIPKTGRTNQIRVHLWSLGFPIVGDPSYLPNQQMAESQTLPIDAPPMCLHAAELEFRHPESGELVRFSSQSPAWLPESIVL